MLEKFAASDKQAKVGLKNGEKHSAKVSNVSDTVATITSSGGRQVFIDRSEVASVTECTQRAEVISAARRRLPGRRNYGPGNTY
ncbi:hypothetical protein [Rhodococcus sp. IEGM 1307]|uniref:hypothetical protein n=1 Tax=Rhodococcus sp. IEGM 1307 TaxID=3047091 RepID=UPI0024B86723|nr:hypothetical protein [Rhodococcus sp. IEGM 1307]MDI9977452.1 hypothetical protein [Rhodococcus sp. IEGM 1307]